MVDVKENMLKGRNVIVFDCETLASAQDCAHCGFPQKAHGLDAYCPPEAGSEHHHDHYTPLGWEDHARLSLSIGCWCDYRDGLMYWFDPHTLESTMRLWVKRQVLIVSFNGKKFDLPLMQAVLKYQERMDSQYDSQILPLCDDFAALAARSYDILHEILTHYGRSTQRGLNSLDALCKANGLPRKQMDGTTAPRLWQEGRIAEVVQYNYFDVLRTKALFEMVCAGQPILRGDGQPITLPPPMLERT